MNGQPGPGPLAALLRDAAAGRFPLADGAVSIWPAASSRDAGVIRLSAHSVIFIDADPDWVAAQLPADDLSGPLAPAFLHALCQRTSRRLDTIDMLLAASPLPGQPRIRLVPEPDAGHPRIARALRYRDDVRAWRGDGGVVLLGRGVAGRGETAVEVDQDRRRGGIGRALAAAARHLVPAGEAVWAQVAPANAASVRAFLAAGFKPVGAEAHMIPGNPGVRRRARDRRPAHWLDSLPV
jgi:GNAT superfamily N-acetyltransferase